MIKAYLVDDEKSSIQSLQYELEAYCENVKVVGSNRKPKEALKELMADPPDLLFLDIEMPDMNGFELLQSMDNIPFDVIFVTAYDQFAMQAFEFNAIDYILKPVRKSKLIAAVQRVDERQQHTFPKVDLDALMNNIQFQSKPSLEKIALPTSDGYKFVHANDIVLLKAESNYTWVHLKTEKYLISKTLKEMATMIAFPQFFRSHKSYLVNLNHVDRYVRGTGGYLILENSEQVPVARGQKEELMRLLNV